MGETSKMQDADGLRVIVVGGGVAGLTLANALEQANVDYVLLERRGEVAIQLGASIGIFPNSARILDQLGVWKTVEEESEPISIVHSRDSTGRLIAEPDESSAMSRKRTGYDTAWGERQKLLRALYENLKDRSKVLVNRGLADIEHGADGVTAVCEDGSSFRGDILIGTDGVFSKTRTKMWEFAEPYHPELVKRDRNCLISEYNCLFGIAYLKGNTGLKPGDLDTSYNPGRCALTIAAEGNKIYFFAQERLSRTYRLGSIPRYTQEETEAFIARNGDIVIRPGPNRLTVADLCKHATTYRLVAIEEAKFKLWHWGRIACAGDSIHKATPNLGIGGNAAIESAAALANGIKRLSDSCGREGRRPTQQEIELMLAEYQKTREVRAAGVVDASWALARAHNIESLKDRFIVYQVMPRFAEFLTERLAGSMIGATKLDYLPLPMRSLTGTRPFNPSQGEGLQESRLKRMLLALPLLGLAFAAFFVMDARPSIQWAEELRDSGVVQLETGSVPILRSFYGIKGFDDLFSLLNTYFFPSVYGYDSASRRQVISFLTDGTVLLTIWMFESVRRANKLTPLQWPNLFALLGQFIGIGCAAPLYCFLHYTLSPIESFASLDQRLTNVRWSRAALPAVLLAYLVPLYITMVWPDLAARQLLLFIWQLYPVWLSLTLYAVSRLWPDTEKTDRVHGVHRDRPTMRWYVGSASVLASAVWLWAAWLPAGQGHGLFQGIREVFLPGGLPRSRTSLVEFTGEFLRWDEVFGFGSHLVWLGYLYWDLTAAGMLKEGWLRMMGLGVLSLLALGPGATLGLGWLWREEILATRRHRDALTVESVGRLHGKFRKD